jgi:hypothetical protein
MPEPLTKNKDEHTLADGHLQTVFKKVLTPELHVPSPKRNLLEQAIK